MNDRFYKATLSQSQGREGWSVIFRHPVLLDRATGKSGRRVRRGLGTKNEKLARKLVEELNQILSDKTYWEASGRSAAASRFNAIVVDIFYHDLEPEATDSVAIRESVIPLPRSAISDYRQILFLGTTGSGKTTLVRQLIGTDPKTERFPSTSTAKTTVADTELVFDLGAFRSVVTFLPRDQVRDYVEECMSAAMLAYYHGDSEADILRRLLNHVNQRFRLAYVLGTGDDDAMDEEGFDSNDIPKGFDLTATRKLLQSVVNRIRLIALTDALTLWKEILETPGDDRFREELFEDSLDHRLRDDEAFQSLADELMDEIERRFELLTVGKLEKTKQGWPRSWTWETEDRATFLKVIARFSSNYAPYFGTLLTPLVNGIRVAGPFAPAWVEKRRLLLVLLDVEGLGHTPDSAASLPTSITRRLDSVDAVLLVDNATQPMQAAPIAAMRNLAAGGHASKLIVAFTHFDGVRGDNLPTDKAKEQHVLASAENALTAIGEQLGPFAERALRKRLESACFFLGGLHEPLTGKSKQTARTVDRLEYLLDAFQYIAVKPEAVPSRPIYDRLNLILAVKYASERFQAAWRSRLGQAVSYGIPKEHWSRVKALSRRLAEGWDDEYLDLKPIADLHKELQESTYRFIQNPVGWTGPLPTDLERQWIFDLFASVISMNLMSMAYRRMRSEWLREWQKAYAISGRGSTFARAVIAKEILEKAAAVHDVAPTPDGNKFLLEVIDAVREAADYYKIRLQ